VPALRLWWRHGDHPTEGMIVSPSCLLIRDTSGQTLARVTQNWQI
jgi:hypothetical protein